MNGKMEVSESKQDRESRPLVKINRATAATLGALGGALIMAIVAIATWKSLIIAPLVNALIFVYRQTGNLGVSILVLSTVVNALSLLVRAPALRAEQKMWELDPSGQELRKRLSEDLSRPWSGCLTEIMSGIWQGFVIVTSIALIWVFWYVFLPKSELLANLDKFLWSPLDPLPESFNTHFAYLDLRDRDLLRVSWWPHPLPGFFILASTVLTFLQASLKHVVRKKHGLALLPKRMTGLILWGGSLLMLLLGLIFPAGAVLYGLGTSAFGLLELWLFPLAVVND
jgi:membrane protein insertase Oxa1/YidC/SpoIIIJ